MYLDLLFSLYTYKAKATPIKKSLQSNLRAESVLWKKSETQFTSEEAETKWHK